MYQSSMMASLKAQRGHKKLKLAFQELIMAIPKNGIRPTELADKLGMHKQNSGTLLKQVENAGYVSRVNDKNDNRAHLVIINKHGQRLLKDALAVTTELDKSIEKLLGHENLSLILECLLKIVAHENLDPNITTATQPGAFVGALISVANFSARELFKIIRADGHTAIRPSHGQVIMYIDNDGTRINTIAKANDVSKQAVARIVSEMEALGYVITAPDPSDKRGKIISLANRGNELIASSVNAAKILLERYANILGPQQLKAFEASMLLVYQVLYRGPIFEDDIHLLQHRTEQSVFAEQHQKMRTIFGILYKLEGRKSASKDFLQAVNENEKRCFKLSPEALDLLKNFYLSEDECTQALYQLREFVGT